MHNPSEIYIEHDYSDNYFKDGSPKHKDLPVHDERPSITSENAERPDKLVIPEKGEHMRLELKDIVSLYEQSRKSPEGTPEYYLLLTVAESIYSTASIYALKPGDPDDHGFGKDCEKYCAVFLEYAHSGHLTHQEAKLLMREIDIVVTGCHNNTHSIPTFIKASEKEGTRLLDAIHNWDEKGSLWSFYLSYNPEKSNVEHENLLEIDETEADTMDRNVQNAFNRIKKL